MVETTLGVDKERDVVRCGSVRLNPPEGAAKSVQSIVFRRSAISYSVFSEVLKLEARVNTIFALSVISN